MNDAIALLAISQLVCIGGLAYLYMQLQSLRSQGRRPRRTGAARIRHVDQSAALPSLSAAQAARQAYAAQSPGRAPGRTDAAAIAARMSELGIDIPALARRMRKSEEGVRLLLRRQGAAR